MPGVNGSGTFGNGPQRGSGRGRRANAIISDTDQSVDLMGLGRGGRPFGCGMGRQAGMRNRRNRGFRCVATTRAPDLRDNE